MADDRRTGGTGRLARLAAVGLRGCVRPLFDLPVAEPLAWRLSAPLMGYFARIGPPLTIVTRYDRTLRFSADLSSHIEAQIFWQGFQAADRGEIRMLGRLLRPEHLVVDVGANVGVVTLFAAKRVLHGAVHAFEPSSEHLRRLRRNLALNDLTNVVVNAVALSNRRGRARLFVPQAGDGLVNTGGTTLFSGVPGTTPEDEIDTLPLDEYVAEAGLGRLDVIKLDVEGAELDVLEGAGDTLERFRPVVLMEVGRPSLAAAGREVGDVLRFWHRRRYRIGRIGYQGEAIAVSVEGDLGPHQDIACWPEERPLFPG